MVSINYSASGATALRSLQATARSMTETQTRIATGLKINSAKDNASLWKAAQGLRSDIKFGQSIDNGLKLAQVQADKTGSALEAIRTVLGDVKNIIDLAGVPGADKVALQADMAASIEQLKSLVGSSSINGTNLLTGTAPSAAIIGKDKDGTVVTMQLDGTNLGLITGATTGLFAAPGASWDTATADATTKDSLMTFNVATAGTSGVGTLASMMTDIITVIGTVDGLVARVASYSKRLETQADYMMKIADIQESALSSLVDADLDEESARLAALQVQQQLATTALQIANQSRTNILQLFQ